MATPVRLHFDALLEGTVPGPTGPAGPTGPTGPAGPVGPTGAAGAAGTMPLAQAFVGFPGTLAPNTISILTDGGNIDYDMPSAAANVGAMIVVIDGTISARDVTFNAPALETMYGSTTMTGAASSRTFIATAGSGGIDAGWLCVAAAGA